MVSGISHMQMTAGRQAGLGVGGGGVGRGWGGVVVGGRQEKGWMEWVVGW